jgi:hypothetical protein
LVECPAPAPASRPSSSTVVAAAASDGGTAPASAGSHAMLHDFCMMLPYSGLALAAGATCLAFATLKPLAAPIAGLGVVSLVLAVASLKAWKAAPRSHSGGGATALTLGNACVAGAAAYLAFPHVTVGTVAWVAGTIVVVSAAAALFCVYNVLAGGNPPPKGKAATSK